MSDVPVQKQPGFLVVPKQQLDEAPDASGRLADPFKAFLVTRGIEISPLPGGPINKTQDSHPSDKSAITPPVLMSVRLADIAPTVQPKAINRGPTTEERKSKPLTPNQQAADIQLAALTSALKPIEKVLGVEEALGMVPSMTVRRHLWTFKTDPLKRPLVRRSISAPLAKSLRIELAATASLTSILSKVVSEECGSFYPHQTHAHDNLEELAYEAISHKLAKLEKSQLEIHRVALHPHHPWHALGHSPIASLLDKPEPKI